MDDKALRNTIYELCRNLSLRIDEIYTVYRNDNQYEAGRLVFMVDDLKDLTDGLGALNPETRPIDLDELNEKLTEMLEAFENKEVLRLMELIKYELQPLLEYTAPENLN